MDNKFNEVFILMKKSNVDFYTIKTQNKNATRSI